MPYDSNVGRRTRTDAIVSDTEDSGLLRTLPESGMVGCKRVIFRALKPEAHSRTCALSQAKPSLGHASVLFIGYGDGADCH